MSIFLEKKYKHIENITVGPEKFISFVKDLKVKNLKLLTISVVKDSGNHVILKYYVEKHVKLFIISATLKKNQIASLFNYFSNADFIEREITETFGVKFVGNPNLNI